MGSLKNLRLQVIVLVTLAAAGLSYWWWTEHYQPLQEEIQTLEVRERSLRAAIDDNRRVVAAIGIDEIEEALEVLDEQADRVSRLVPESGGEPELLPLVTGLSDHFSVNVSQITPTGDVSVAGPFRARGYRLDVSGRYHDVAGFMTALLSLDVITQVRDAQFQASPGLPGGLPGSISRFGDLAEPGQGWGVRGSFTLVSFAFRE